MLLSDSYNRRLNYLRVSVTDRCNLRCVYCIPSSGFVPMQHSQILSYEELAGTVRVAVDMGITKVRITGGEPLVRKGIVGFVGMLAHIPGIEDLSMTTNGILLDIFARDLAVAGLHRVNVSLDTLDSVQYNEMTRGGELSRVLAGIQSAKEAGLAPIKLNCVVKGAEDKDRANQVVEFGKKNGYSVRLIQWMSLSDGDFSRVDGGDGGNCAECNRLRITANGDIIPCLFSNQRFNVRELGPEKALLMATACKPASGETNRRGDFYNIGG